RAAPGHAGDGRRAGRVLPAAPGELQETRGDPLSRRAAEEPDGQGAAPRAARAGRGRVSRGVARGPAVEVAVQDGVAWLTLARPARRNQLDDEMRGPLADTCQAVEHDDSVRVAVLAAAGEHFCAGLPPGIAWPDAASPDGVAALAALSKPAIACLAGTVRGWGLALALACDLRVAATTAVLELPEVSRGRLPGGGGAQRRTRLVGTA